MNYGFLVLLLGHKNFLICDICDLRSDFCVAWDIKKIKQWCYILLLSLWGLPFDVSTSAQPRHMSICFRVSWHTAQRFGVCLPYVCLDVLSIDVCSNRVFMQRSKITSKDSWPTKVLYMFLCEFPAETLGPGICLSNSPHLLHFTTGLGLQPGSFGANDATLSIWGSSECLRSNPSSNGSTWVVPEQIGHWWHADAMRYKLSYVYQRPSPFGAEGIGAGEDGWNKKQMRSNIPAWNILFCNCEENYRRETKPTHEEMVTVLSWLGVVFNTYLAIGLSDITIGHPNQAFPSTVSRCSTDVPSLRFSVFGVSVFEGHFCFAALWTLELLGFGLMRHTSRLCIYESIWFYLHGFSFSRLKRKALKRECVTSLQFCPQSLRDIRFQNT